MKVCCFYKTSRLSNSKSARSSSNEVASVLYKVLEVSVIVDPSALVTFAVNVRYFVGRKSKSYKSLILNATNLYKTF